jgi:hypothetical protein
MAISESTSHSNTVTIAVADSKIDLSRLIFSVILRIPERWSDLWGGF